MRLKASAFLLGAVVASTFPTQIKHGALAQGSAIEPFPAAAEETVSVPEFVPVINFSEFLLAVEQNAPQSERAREAAEALSAKFSVPPDTLSDAEPAMLRPDGPVGTVIADGRDRPALAEAYEAEIAVVADPVRAPHSGQGPAPDPARPGLKTTTSVAQLAAVPVKAAKVPAASGDNAENATAETFSRPRPAKRFKPAMGLGAENIATEDQPKKRSDRSQRRRLAAADKAPETRPATRAAKTPDAHADDQRGIPGQAWEPLISNCAKIQRDCHGAFFCGC